MRKIIHHIRRQPEEVRRHLLHILTITAGIILILIWILTLRTSFTDSDTRTKAENDLKPFSALKANLVGGYESIPDSGQAEE